MFAASQLLGGAGGPLLSSPLPPYSGPHGVGTIDIEVRAGRPRQFLGGAVHRETGRAALELETVLFSLFYPCAQPKEGAGSGAGRPGGGQHHHPWIPAEGGGTALYAEGYARFAGVGGWWGAAKALEAGLWSLVGSTTIPAEVDVPLLQRGRATVDRGAVPAAAAAAEGAEGSKGGRGAQRRDNEQEGAHVDTDRRQGQDQDQQHVVQTGHHGEGDDDDDDGWPPSEPAAPARFPVIVFSHGMASGRTSYTQYLGELASRGYVVAAVEHRDGSGPGTVVMNKTEGTQRTVFHAPREMFDPVPEVDELKRAQLALREAEVAETVRVLRAIAGGVGNDVFAANTRAEGTRLKDWAGRLDMDRVVMAGHSYGATLALQALPGSGSGAGRGEAPGSDDDDRPSFVAGVALDPGKHSGRLNADVGVPLLIVHSQSWSAAHSVFYGRPHFDTVADIARGVARDAWFLTARGTTHPTVTDAPLIEPLLLAWTTGATVGAHAGLLQYADITDDFVRRVLADGGGGGDHHHRKGDGILGQPVSHPRYNEESRPLPPGLTGHWQVHVSPVS